MPRTQFAKEYSMVGVRMPTALREKLEALALATGQTSSAIIRLLIQQVELTHAPLFRLSVEDEQHDDPL